MSTNYTSIGILPYTLLPATTASVAPSSSSDAADATSENKTPSIAFMLWLDRRSTLIESSQYYSHVICPASKTDKSTIDTVLRVFHTKTHGIFVPQSKKQSIAGTQVQLQQRLRSSLTHPTASAAVTNSGHLMYICPVRYTPAADVNKACLDHGSIVWVKLEDLLSLLHSSTPAALLRLTTKPLVSTSAVATDAVTLPLYLPFTALMRSEQATSSLAHLMNTFNIMNNSSCLFDEVTDNQDENCNNSKQTLESHDESKDLVNYCCSRCRQKLFSNQDLVDHESGVHQRYFSGKGVQASIDRSLCTSYFINPSHNLADISFPEGKLTCPKCLTRVGTFSWPGAQCSCGEWITPAFQIPKSRVDDRAFQQSLTQTRKPIILQRSTIN